MNFIIHVAIWYSAYFLFHFLICRMGRGQSFVMVSVISFAGYALATILIDGLLLRFEIPQILAKSYLLSCLWILHILVLINVQNSLSLSILAWGLERHLVLDKKEVLNKLSAKSSFQNRLVKMGQAGIIDFTDGRNTLTAKGRRILRVASFCRLLFGIKEAG